MLFDQKLRELLLQSGLSEAEVLVYLELKKSPVVTKWELVARTGLNRNKVYRSFEKLCSLKMICESNDGFKAGSLKNFIGKISDNSKKLDSLARKIKHISKYAASYDNSFEEFEVIYDQDRFLETYIKMSELRYDTALDFGDFETFAGLMIKGLDPAFKYRELRAKHAKSHSICTLDGPYTRCMARKSFLDQFKAKLDVFNVDSFKNKWVIFSDKSDYTMFNDMSDQENPYSVLIKSKIVADIQRANFKSFSQMIENC